jgi:hypothetical protein
MTLAIVNVFPEPVTPSKTWSRRPSSTPRTNASMARGWSPLGSYSDANSNGIKFTLSAKTLTTYGRDPPPVSPVLADVGSVGPSRNIPEMPSPARLVHATDADFPRGFD